MTGKVATLNRFVSRATDNSIDTLIRIPCFRPTSIRKKEIQKEVEKKKNELCSSSAIVKTRKLCLSSATTSDSEAI